MERSAAAAHPAAAAAAPAAPLSAAYHESAGVVLARAFRCLLRLTGQAGNAPACAEHITAAEARLGRSIPAELKVRYRDSPRASCREQRPRDCSSAGSRAPAGAPSDSWLCCRCLQALWCVSDGHGSWPSVGDDEFAFPSVAQLRFMCTRGGWKDEAEDAADSAGIGTVKFWDGTGGLSRSFFAGSPYWPLSADSSFQQWVLWDAEHGVAMEVDLEIGDPGPPGLAEEGLAGLLHACLEKEPAAQGDEEATQALERLAPLRAAEHAQRRHAKQHLARLFERIHASTGLDYVDGKRGWLGGCSEDGGDEDGEDDGDDEDGGGESDTERAPRTSSAEDPAFLAEALIQLRDSFLSSPPLQSIPGFTEGIPTKRRGLLPANRTPPKLELIIVVHCDPALREPKSTKAEAHAQAAAAAVGGDAASFAATAAAGAAAAGILSADMLTMVCTYCDTGELLALRRVSRHWARVSRTKAAWASSSVPKHIAKRIAHGALTPAEVELAGLTMPFVRSVTLPGVEQMQPMSSLRSEPTPPLAPFMAAFPLLERLCLEANQKGRKGGGLVVACDPPEQPVHGVKSFGLHRFAHDCAGFVAASSDLVLERSRFLREGQFETLELCSMPYGTLGFLALHPVAKHVQRFHLHHWLQAHNARVALDAALRPPIDPSLFPSIYERYERLQELTVDQLMQPLSSPVLWGDALEKLERLFSTYLRAITSLPQLKFLRLVSPTNPSYEAFTWGPGGRSWTVEEDYLGPLFSNEAFNERIQYLQLQGFLLLPATFRRMAEACTALVHFAWTRPNTSLQLSDVREKPSCYLPFLPVAPELVALHGEGNGKVFAAARAAPEHFQSLTAFPAFEGTSFEELRIQGSNAPPLSEELVRALTPSVAPGAEAAAQQSKGNKAGRPERYQSLTCLPQFEHSSFEELRLEGYNAPVRHGPAMTASNVWRGNCFDPFDPIPSAIYQPYPQLIHFLVAPKAFRERMLSLRLDCADPLCDEQIMQAYPNLLCLCYSPASSMPWEFASAAKGGGAAQLTVSSAVANDVPRVPESFTPTEFTQIMESPADCVRLLKKYARNLAERRAAAAAQAAAAKAPAAAPAAGSGSEEKAPAAPTADGGSKESAAAQLAAAAPNFYHRYSYQFTGRAVDPRSL